MQNFTKLDKIRVGVGPPPADFPDSEVDPALDPHADGLVFLFDREDGEDGYTLGWPGRIWVTIQSPTDPEKYRRTPVTDIDAYAPVSGGSLVVPDADPDPDVEAPVGGYYAFGQHPPGAIHVYMQVASIDLVGPVCVRARTSKNKEQI